MSRLEMMAFDFGAGSGRAIVGGFDGAKLDVTEVHRFRNDPVCVNGSWYWDILRLFHELKQGLTQGLKMSEAGLRSIGVDSWGVDFGLLDSHGQMLGNPFHYRDQRTEGMIERACQLVPKREIYEQTGIQILKLNTIYQLLAMKLTDSPLLEKAATMLFIPDLLNYFLTGVKVSEATIASTSQMLNPTAVSWNRQLLGRLGIPLHILTEIVPPGSIVGSVQPEIVELPNLGQLPVVAVAGHDTASAVAAVPASQERFAYLSCGTWSLLGTELPHPVVSDTTYRLNYTNEGGVNRTYRLLKNNMGLWIYQECKRAWELSGRQFSFDELEGKAGQAQPFRSLIDPDDELFYQPGRMPEKVIEYCRRTDQPLPAEEGEIVRCVLESLALKYRMVLEGLEQIVGYSFPVLHIVGGGCQNKMLCRFTAGAIGRPVIAGPIEATAIGNLVTQLMALQVIHNLDEGREIVRNSFPGIEYRPEQAPQWDEALMKFAKIIGGTKE